MSIPTTNAPQESNSVSGEIVIKVIGVGGCGNNAVRHMISSGLQGATFIAANTDVQALAVAHADHTIELDPDFFLEGNMPEADAIGGAHLVFIVAGMGGATGTEGAPVIARVAKEAGAGLIVGVVTTPFRFEGKRRTERGEAGIAALYRHVDCLIVLPNEHLYSAPQQCTLRELFMQADETMAAAVRCISNMLTRPGPINTSFADVASVLRGPTAGVMGVGAASGENRARYAAMRALSSPLLEGIPLGDARGVLLNITAGPEVSIAEMEEAHAVVLSGVHADAAVFMSLTLDHSMDDEMRITFIATFN